MVAHTCNPSPLRHRKKNWEFEACLGHSKTFTLTPTPLSCSGFLTHHGIIFHMFPVVVMPFSMMASLEVEQSHLNQDFSLQVYVINKFPFLIHFPVPVFCYSDRKWVNANVKTQEPGTMMPHAFNPSMRRVEAGVALRFGCSPYLHSETLSQKSKQQQQQQQPGPSIWQV